MFFFLFFFFGFLPQRPNKTDKKSESTVFRLLAKPILTPFIRVWAYPKKTYCCLRSNSVHVTHLSRQWFQYVLLSTDRCHRNSGGTHFRYYTSCRPYRNTHGGCESNIRAVHPEDTDMSRRLQHVSCCSRSREYTGHLSVSIERFVTITIALLFKCVDCGLNSEKNRHHNVESMPKRRFTAQQ